MFKRLGVKPGTLDGLTRLESVVRMHFAVGEDELVLVSEDQGIKPGFPPLETNVIFWRENTRYRLKLFKSVGAVEITDLPPRWMLPSLEDDGTADCC